MGFNPEGELVTLVRWTPEEPLEIGWFDPQTLNEIRSVEIAGWYHPSPDVSLLVSQGRDSLGATSGTQVPYTVRSGLTGEVVGSFEDISDGVVTFSPDGSLLSIFDFQKRLVIRNTTDFEVEKVIRLARTPWDSIWLDNETIALIYQEGSVATVSTNDKKVRELVVDRLTRSLSPIVCQEYDIEPCPSLQDLRGG